MRQVAAGVAHQLLGDRCAAAQEEPQGWKALVAIELRVIDHVHQKRSGRRHEGAAFPVDRRQRPVRVPMLEQYQAALDGQRHAQRMGESDRVTEGRAGEDPIVRIEGVVLDEASIDRGEYVAVEDDAFQVPRRPRGEAECGHVVEARFQCIEGFSSERAEQE